MQYKDCFIITPIVRLYAYTHRSIHMPFPETSLFLIFFFPPVPNQQAEAFVNDHDSVYILYFQMPISKVLFPLTLLLLLYQLFISTYQVPPPQISGLKQQAFINFHVFSGLLAIDQVHLILPGLLYASAVSWWVHGL